MTSDGISPKGSGGRGSGGSGGVKAGPVGVDTSREAVEATAQMLDQEVRRLCGAESKEAKVLRALLTERDALQARAGRAEAERDDAFDTLNAWFDRRELAHDAIDETVLDAARGYLRTSRSGGMGKETSDMIEGVIADMARLSVFADLFARATLAQLNAEPAGVSEPVDVSDTDKAVLRLMEKEKLRREVWEQAKEAAAQYLESQAPFTEEQISGATSFALLDNISQVDRSRNCRKDAAAIRAMEYPGDSQ